MYTEEHPKDGLQLALKATSIFGLEKKTNLRMNTVNSSQNPSVITLFGSDGSGVS